MNCSSCAADTIPTILEENRKQKEELAVLRSVIELYDYDGKLEEIIEETAQQAIKEANKEFEKRLKVCIEHEMKK